MRRTPNYNLPIYENGDKFYKEDLSSANERIDTAIRDIQETINNASLPDVALSREVNEVKSQLANTQAQFNDAVGAITEDSEVILARDDKATLGENIAEIKSELVEKVNKTSSSLSSELKALLKYPVSIPFNFSIPNVTFNVYKNASSEVVTNLEASNYAHNEGVTYYVSKGGSDSNDGLTIATALAKISTARGKSDVGTIIVGTGYYSDIDGFNNLVNQNKSISIKAAEGANVIISTFRTLTWTKTSGKTNVYEASRTSVLDVWDSEVLDAFGDYTKLTPVSSIDLVDSTPGSYYYAASMLYIHTPNSRPADAEIKVGLNVRNFYNVGSYRTYLEGLKLYGGNNGNSYVSASASTDTPLFVAKNCEFKYSSSGVGGVVLDGADSILQNCIAARNYADGFNYHKNANRICSSVEISCIGRRNGLGRNGNTDNGSTVHDGCKVIRINGEYYNNEGPNIHDINVGSNSLNIGCDSHSSVATVATRRVNYMSEDKANVWLDSCIESDSDYSVRAEPNSNMYIRDCILTEGLPNITGSLYQY